MKRADILEIFSPTGFAKAVAEDLAYTQYRAQREMGLSAATLARFFGDVPGEQMEQRFRKESGHAS